MGSPTHTHQPNANEKASKEAKQGEPMPVFTRFLQSDDNTPSYIGRDSATWRLRDGRNTAAFGKEDQGWDQE